MTYSTIADIIECYENKWTWVAIEYSAMKEVNQLVENNSELLEALQVATIMLTGTCQHGYDTSRSARGCDECAAQIEAVIAKVTGQPLDTGG